MIIFASLKTLTFDWAVLCKEKLAARPFYSFDLFGYIDFIFHGRR